MDAAALAGADPARGHLEGRTAAQLLEQATTATASVVGAEPDRLVWTSGGTEAVHLAVAGAAAATTATHPARDRLVVSAVEHTSVLAAARQAADRHRLELVELPVDAAGLVDPEVAAAAIDERTAVVHLQHANHEVGAIQPVAEVARRCHEVGALLHVDACQTVGQLGLRVADLGADLLSASSAKFGGPQGVGFLALGERGRVLTQLPGDDRQRRRRAGQLPIPAVAAAAVALQVAVQGLSREWSAREVVRRHLRAELARIEDVAVHGPLADAHPGIVAVSALYVDGEALVAGLDRSGFAVHSGSSCATTSGEPSHVLMAMGALTHGHVRLSVGPDTTVADADRFLTAYGEVVDHARATIRRPPRPSRS